MENKVIAYRVEYEDGTVAEATGETANEILKWFRACEVMNYIHGAKYTGPQPTVTKKEK